MDLKLCLEIAYVKSNFLMLFIFDPKASSFNKHRPSMERLVYQPAVQRLKAISNNKFNP